MAAFEAWLVFLILVVNVVGELQRKRTLAASRGFLAAARLSCFIVTCHRQRSTKLSTTYANVSTHVFRPIVDILSILCELGSRA